MRANRRVFLKGALASVAGVQAMSAAGPAPGEVGAIPEWDEPLFNFRTFVKAPVKIESIELLRNGSVYFLRTRSSDGAEGLTQTKQVSDFVPILSNIVAPYYLGKDARDLEQLVDGVYHENYKLAGLPFWCPVAYVEQSLLDMLGKIASKPVGELLGGVRRKEIPIYLSGSGRDTTAEQEVDVYVRGVQVTGAKAVKFKIGGRMSRNADAYPGRTDTLLELARKRLGDEIILYADANGSYDSTKAIQVGRRMMQLGYKFFEEPCPWEEVSETKKVADALEIPIAFGEQDSSLWMFHWLIENGALQIVQPDLNYCGGLIRASRVARMARKKNVPIVPHNTETAMNTANILQFASATPNIGPRMEFAWRAPRKPVSWYHPNVEVVNGAIKVPEGPGMGFTVDPDYLKKAQIVKG